MLHVSDLPRTAVVIPAAGRGLRMGGQRKQFRLLGQAPLLVQTTHVFVHHPRVQQIVVAAPADEVDLVSRVLSQAFPDAVINVVVGGQTRAASVRAALRSVGSDVSIVLVHDAVRPFVEREQIDHVIEATATDGAAAPAIAVADTLRMGLDTGVFGDEIDRAGALRVQTPQGFRRTLLEEAFAAATRKIETATDDVSLVAALGNLVTVVPGSSFNFKITTEDDWELALMLWPAWSARSRKEAS